MVYNEDNANKCVYTEIGGIVMRSTQKKSIRSTSTKTVYACGKIWSKESLKKYREYQQDFIANRYRAFAFRLVKLSDADIIEYLEGKENLTQYLKELIKKDMIENNFQPSEEAKRKMEIATMGDNLSDEERASLDEAIKAQEEADDKE